MPIYEPFLVGAIINPYFSNSVITLVASGDVGSFVDNGNNYFQYRYVLIPGGVRAGRGSNYLNWNDYNQVKAFLKLKD